MKPRIFFLIGLLLVLAVFSRLLDTRLRTIKENFYFVPSPAYLAVASATHTTLVAYVFFIRGILDISEEFPAGVNRMEYLLKNFKAVSTLEPNIAGVYLFAGVVAPRTPEDMALANRFLAEGMERNPQDWKIPYWIGFNHLQSGDYAAAVDFYRLAAAKPGSPNFLKTNLAYLYYRSGEVDEGLIYLQSMLLSVNDARIIEMIEKKIAWLKDIATLQRAAEQYQQRFGNWPATLSQLQEKGLIGESLHDSFGKGFYLEPGKDGGRPRVKSRRQLEN